MIKYLIAFLLIASPCLAGMGIGGFPQPGPGVVVASGGGDPTPPIVDDFNRGAGSLGANWTTTTDQQAPSISASENVFGGVGRTGAYYSASSYNSDQIACVKVVTKADAVGVAVRTQSGAQTQYVAMTNGTNIIIRKHSNGTISTIGDPITDMSAGSVLCLSATGSATVILKAYVDGIEVGERTDSTSTITGGSPGIFLYSTTPRLDDFRAGNL